jgi:hypothetical protein
MRCFPSDCVSFPSDCVRRSVQVAVMGSYVEAYDEAVEVFLQRDLTAWRRLLVFRQSFLAEAWEKPLSVPPSRLSF